MKNLLLITHWYYPRNNPRSFRARALADELIKRGYDVDILIGEQKNLVEESELEDFYSEKSESEGKASDKVKKCVFLKKILTFFIGEKFTVCKNVFQKNMTELSLLVILFIRIILL